MAEIDNYRGSSLQLSHLLDGWEVPAWREELPIGILTGEGVGPEVIGACIPVLDAMATNTPYSFDLIYGGAIGKAAREATGAALSDQVTEFCQTCFSKSIPLFCGPGGDRFVYDLRSRFDVYCKLVPLQPFPALADTGVLQAAALKDVDILLIRENTGGLYQGSWHTEWSARGRVAHQVFSYTEEQVSRILKVAVNAAEKRRGSICVVTKPAGAPAISDLWFELANQYALDKGVGLRFLEVDTAAYLVVAQAGSFDVIVTPNMFGDVIADVAALLLGSRGMSFSSNLGNAGVAVYQTGHGAAYDLAGTQTANPLGQIQSLAAMLAQSFGLPDLARTLLVSCNETLASGLRTADIMRPGATLVSTAEMGEAVAEALTRHLTTQRQPTASLQTS